MIKRFLIGTPIPSHQECHERLNIPLALAVFAADALSSSAYATEEILLAFMGTQYALQGNFLSLPVALAILLLLTIVVISYRQVICAYPDGGGAYIVSKENMGKTASQVAGASLLIDYILTAAVSISAGVAAITSTGLVPFQYRVVLALGFLLFIMLINLRGVRESGKAIAIPAYTFIGIMTVMLLLGLAQVITGEAHTGINLVPTEHLVQQSTQDLVINGALIFALMRAFSHGCAALTGIEAISNGVKAFREPVAKHANQTMVWMGVILAFLFTGLTYLAFTFQVIPKETETVISQVARSVFGGEHPLYYLVQLSTMIILILAANTSFAGFPRLANLLADDGFLPRQLMSLGDKLVFSNGIILLGFLSGVLIILYRADTHALIPLYAVGVFLSFTLAQASMVLHHRNAEQKCHSGMLVNALGAIVTGFVTLLLGIEKFSEGAWIVIVAIPTMIIFFGSIQSHYRSIGKQLALEELDFCPIPIEHTVLVLVSSLNKGTMPALEYARSISKRVEAVHIELKPEATHRLKEAWDKWHCDIPLTILKSPYRSIITPLMDYIEEVESRYEHDLVTIIIPEFVTKKFWHNILHNQTAILIKALLRFKRGKVVTTVRYYLEE